ncbi:MAG TPA: hypothetical protein EYN57_02955 [Candidatus Lambdaproteobacteria bacterium]|nr:hypothetical protein [Candidatus Lambdaproteobacteria bacterium]
MNFFHFIDDIVVFPGISAGISTSVRQLSSMEKLIFFHDQGTFSMLFVGSLLLHLVLGLTIGVLSELWVAEPPPIRARIGVRYAKLPVKTTPIKRPKPLVEKPVLQKLETELKPKLQKLVPNKPVLQKLVPNKPVLQKPVLNNALKKTTLQKPALKKTEAPRLKLSQPQLKPSVPGIKRKSPQTPKALKMPRKPLLLPPDSPERISAITNFPKFSKDPVPLSPITSKKSALKPSQIELHKFSQDEISPKKLNTPKFSKPIELPLQRLPQIIQPSLIDIPSISPVQPAEKPADDPETSLEELFPKEIQLKEPLQDLGIPDQPVIKKTKEMLDTNYLQRKKIVQLAGEEYNLHIRTQIIPKLGSYPSELFVRILLKIVPSGKIISYEFIKKSNSSSFDQAAELAVRNAVLAPLPPALAENPPYIVLIRIVPQN